MRCTALRRPPIPTPACVCGPPSATRRPSLLHQGAAGRSRTSPTRCCQLADLEFHAWRVAAGARRCSILTSATSTRLRTCCCSACGSRAAQKDPLGAQKLRAQAAAGFPRLRPDPCAGRSRPQPGLNVVTRAGGTRSASARGCVPRANAGGSPSCRPPRNCTSTLRCSSHSRRKTSLALGADVYVRGHLRRYAELVGESSGELQDLYAQRRPARCIRTSPSIPRVERPRRSPRTSCCRRC